MNISVIIPVYNGERYLLDCLESVTSQSYRELELIVVNDGSTDSTPDILTEYAKVEPRLRVLTQGNKGLVAAWKAGLEAATGEYVGFVDADDYLSPGYLQELSDSMAVSKPQLVVGSVFEVGAAGESPQFRSPKTPEGTYLGTHLDWCLSGTMWTRERPMVQARWSKLIDRTAALKAAESVPVDMTLGEDQVFFCALLLQIDQAQIVRSAGGYFYRRHGDSMTNTADFSYWTEYRRALDQIESILRSTGYQNANRLIAGDLVNAAVTALFKVITVDDLAWSQTFSYTRDIVRAPGVTAAAKVVDSRSGGVVRRVTLRLLRMKLSGTIVLWLLMNRMRIRLRAQRG